MSQCEYDKYSSFRCHNMCYNGKKYCDKHICFYDGCNNGQYTSGTHYCCDHVCTGCGGSRDQGTLCTSCLSKTNDVYDTGCCSQCGKKYCVC